MGYSCKRLSIGCLGKTGNSFYFFECFYDLGVLVRFNDGFLMARNWLFRFGFVVEDGRKSAGDDWFYFMFRLFVWFHLIYFELRDFGMWFC